MDLDPWSDAVVVVDPLGHGSRTGGGLTQLLACSREAGTTIVAVVGDVASHGTAYAATIDGPALHAHH
jgi:hypothetical protein